MTELASFALVSFSAIFFVVDPFAVIPLFVTMTAGESAAKRAATAMRSTIVMTCTLLLFAITGSLIFQIFGITIGAFKIAGGILLFLMAVDMMRAQRSRTRTSPEEESEGVVKEDVAIIPLAIPMLSGPGSIATVTVQMSEAAGRPPYVAVVICSILLTGALTFLLFRGAGLLERTLKTTGLNIVVRIMGLLLAAVAVQYVVGGIRDVLPQIRGE